MNNRLEERVRNSGVGELLKDVVALVILSGVTYWVANINPGPIPADMIIHEEVPHSHYSDAGYDSGDH